MATEWVMDPKWEAPLKEARELSVKAEELAGKGANKMCISGHAIFWLPLERALIPGHVYSQSGMDETRISSCCEFCFDKMFDEDWQDVVTGEWGPMHEYTEIDEKEEN